MCSCQSDGFSIAIVVGEKAEVSFVLLCFVSLLSLAALAWVSLANSSLRRLVTAEL